MYPSFPGYEPPQPQPRRRWYRRHPILAGLAGSVGVLIVLGVIGAALGGSHPARRATTAPAASPATPAQAPAPAPSDTTTDPTGGIGATFTVTVSDGTSYDVTLDKVIQHARTGQYDSLTNYQDHAAAAEFTITGDTGQSSDDANTDANVIGSDQTQYQYTALTDRPNFSYGEFKVAPGQTVKGWVTFELPPGVTVDQVQWAPGSFDSQAATWTVNG